MRRTAADEDRARAVIPGAGVVAERDRAAARRWLVEAGATPAEVTDLLLAVGESTSNVVEHAYGPGGHGERSSRASHPTSSSRWRTAGGGGRRAARTGAAAHASSKPRPTTWRSTRARAARRSWSGAGSAVVAGDGVSGARVTAVPDGGRIRLVVSGEVDLANADAVEADLLRAITNQVVDVSLDLGDVAYLDSAGLRVLFHLVDRLATLQIAVEVAASMGSPARRVVESLGPRRARRARPADRGRARHALTPGPRPRAWPMARGVGRTARATDSPGSSPTPCRWPGGGPAPSLCALVGA